MAKLLVSGASWTSSWPLEQQEGHRNSGWPCLVAKHFDFELIDKSRAGSSNYRIYRKAFDEIINGVDIAIVFWTTWQRFETGATYGEKPGRIYQHQPSNKESSKAFKLFFNGYLQYTDFLRQIISLQNLSLLTNTPCFFLANLDYVRPYLFNKIKESDFKEILMFNDEVFNNMDDERIFHKLQKIRTLEPHIDWSKFICTTSYIDFYKDFDLDQGHPTHKSHKMIASTIINFLLNSNKLDIV